MLATSSSRHWGPNQSVFTRSQTQLELDRNTGDPVPTNDPTTVAFESVKNAVTSSLERDTRVLGDLSETLSATASSNYTEPRNEAWAPFELLKSVPIPQKILSEYKFLGNPNSIMGTFSDIDRAYIVLNETLYLWDYVEGQANSYDTYQNGSEHTIHVALVPAKPGVFVDAITHVLVITRQTMIELVPVSAGAGAVASGSLPRRELNMFESDLSVKNEVGAVCSVVGTHEGRVFLCATGDLFELFYQSQETWIGRKTSLKNHSISGLMNLIPSQVRAGSNDDITQLSFDSTRNTLYALTDSMKIIQFFVPPKSSNAPERITTVVDVARKAQSLFPGGQGYLDAKTFRINHLIPLERSESNKICLLAVATNGVRLYFSRLDSYGRSLSDDSRTRISLFHVRMPPLDLPDPFQTPPTGFQQPNNAPIPRWANHELQCSAYKLGLWVASEFQPDVDMGLLLCTAPEIPVLARLATNSPQAPSQHQIMPATQRPLLQETGSLLQITGIAWAVTSNPAPPSISTSAGWNEMVTQFSGPPLSFLVLTNTAMHMVSRRRPVKVLATLFEDYTRTADIHGLEDFLQTYGQLETLAMALAIAADNTYIDTPQTLYSPVASDSVLMSAGLGVTSIITVTKEYAKAFFYEFGSRRATTDSSLAPSRFSPRYDALALYFSRLVRPLWKTKITEGTPDVQKSTLSSAVLMSIQRDLEKLKSFLASNPQLFLPPHQDFDNRNGLQHGDQESLQAENNAAMQLQILINHTIEAISFIMLLSDYNMPVTVGKMDEALRRALFALSYEDFLTTPKGKETARSLVNAVITQQISQQISVDAISEILQARCASFCSADDVMLYKAQEQVRKAKEAPPSRDRGIALEQSLKLFEKGAKHLTLAKLQQICQDYKELHFTNGLVGLPLKCANDWDTDGRGEAYFDAGCPLNDPRSEEYNKRTACYKCVTDALKAYDDDASAALDKRDEAKAQESNQVYNHAMNIALQSQDFAFHSFLYDALISYNVPTDLLALQSPLMEKYLQHEPRSLEKRDLLWQYYVQNGMSMQAAIELGSLAESTQYGLTLEQRVEYLSRAISNAKSTSGDGARRYGADGEFLSDLEDKLEVAMVQVEIYGRLSHSTVPPAEAQNVEMLTTNLLDVTQLYTNYADRYDMDDMKLLILHTSEHQDIGLVTSIWTSIVESYRDKPDPFTPLGLRVSDLARRFYPSEIALPLNIVTELLENYSLFLSTAAPPGWALRVLVNGNIPPELVLEYFDTIKDSGVPPYQNPAAIEHVLEDITSFLGDWLDEVLRPGSRFVRSNFPAGAVDQLVSRYLMAMRSVNDDPLKNRLLDIQSKVRSRF